MPQKSIFRLAWGTLLLASILAAAHGISDADKQRMLEGAIGSTLASAPRTCSRVTTPCCSCSASCSS